MTETAFSSVKVITDGQLPGVRGLRGHLLHTVPFLVVFFFLFFFVVVVFFVIFSSQLNVRFSRQKHSHQSRPAYLLTIGRAFRALVTHNSQTQT